jgi:UDP-N-acetylglucosamine 3-dehydrogenase
MAMSKLKVGIVGCGLIAPKRHIPAFLKQGEKTEISAVCDLNEALAREVARRFSIPNTYSSVSNMLSDQSLDIVDICTPPQTHAQIAIEALEKGVNVLIEKPMALTVSDCDEMIRAAKESNVKLTIAHNNIFHPAFLEAKERIRRGEIGDFTGMRILLSTPRHDLPSLKNHWVHRLPGGIIGETGPHIVYMSLAFLENVREVHARARKVLGDNPWMLFDDYRIILDADNGISSAASVYHGSDWRADVEILGSDSILQLDLEAMSVVKYGRKDLSSWALGLSSLTKIAQTTEALVSNVMKVSSGRTKVGHDFIVEKFVESILHDFKVPVAPEEGRETTRIMELIARDLEKNRDAERSRR